jgi:hypothetical protein
LIDTVKKAVVRFAKNRRVLAAVLVFAIGMILVVASSGGKHEDAADATTLDEYGRELEKTLESFCSSVEGVGKCRVMVTFEEGAVYEYKSGNLISQTPPKVKGITVLCRGGESLAVKAQLAEMLSGLFEIGKNRICVLKLSS